MRQINNLNIYIVYKHPKTSTNKIIHDVKESKVISDGHKKPFAWEAIKTLEFESNFEGTIHEHTDITWIFAASKGKVNNKNTFSVKKGSNKIQISLGLIGERDGKLDKNALLPKLIESKTFKDHNDNELFSYTLNYKITKY